MGHYEAPLRNRGAVNAHESEPEARHGRSRQQTRQHAEMPSAWERCKVHLRFRVASPRFGERSGRGSVNGNLFAPSQYYGRAASGVYLEGKNGPAPQMPSDEATKRYSHRLWLGPAPGVGEGYSAMTRVLYPSAADKGLLPDELKAYEIAFILKFCCYSGGGDKTAWLAIHTTPQRPWKVDSSVRLTNSGWRGGGGFSFVGLAS